MQTTITRDNLILNPSFEIDLANWTVAYGAVISRDTTQAKFGTACLKGIGAAVLTGGFAGYANTDVTVENGVTYIFTIYVKGDVQSAGDTGNLYVGSAATNVNVYFTITTNWQRVSITFTAGSTTAGIYLRTGQVNFVAYWDGAQLEKGTVAQPYLDGSLGLGYYWNGTAHNSTSRYNSFEAQTAAPVRNLIYGVLVSWLRTISPTAVKFFQIGQSTIGGPDKIKSAGTASITFFDKYAYTDESARASRWAITRKLSQYPWGMVMAQADIDLINADKRFMPAFDATIGAYVDKPNRPVKISVGFGTEPIMQFVGFTDQPESTLVDRRVTLRAFDALNFLNTYKIANLGIQVNKYTHEIIESILLEAGFSASQYSLETSLQQKIGYISLKDKQAGAVLRDLVEAEMGLLFVDENGIIRFWNRQHLNNTSTPVYTFSYANMRNVGWGSSPVINDIQVIAKPRFVAASQKIWENASAIKIEAGQSLLVAADFRDDNGSLPVSSIVTPVNIASAVTSYWTSNLTDDGNGTNAAAYTTLTSASLVGDTYLMTFTNSYTQPIYLFKVVLFGTPAKLRYIESTRQIDATSVTNYDRNPTGNGEPLIVTNDMIQDVSTANSIAYTLMKEYSTPRKRLRCTVFAVPQLQLGDYVTVQLADTGESLNMFIMGLNIKLDRGGNLQQDLELEQKVIKRYFRIGISRIGQTDTIAP